MIKFPRAFIPPLAIATAAALVAASAVLFRPDAKAVSVPVDLRAGAVQTIEFRAAYSKSYVIGIEMDQKDAKELFPCMADGSSPAFGRCETDEFPLALSLALVADGTDDSIVMIRRDSSTAGGRYGGDETFTRDVGYTELSRGKKYELAIRSLTDGTAPTSTNPRLVIEVHPLDLKGEALMRALAVVVAAVLGLVAAIWTLGVYVRRRARLGRSART